MRTAPISAAEGSPDISQAQLALGLVGLLVWLAAFGVVEFAHDQMMAVQAGEAKPALAHLAYEIAGGYVLGFITALAVFLLNALVRGREIDMFPDMPWARWLSVLGLIGVIVSCLAGFVMHNFGGLTLSYDIAFVVGVVVVAGGVLPLYKHLDANRRR